MPSARIDDTLEMHYELDDYTPPWLDDAETVVLHHGAGKSGKLWYFWAPYLATEFRIVRPDARGFGQSSPIPPGYRYTLSGLANDLRLLLDRLGIERAHLVGETVGGPTCMQFAYEYPERVRSLTLSGAPHRLNLDPDYFHRGREQVRTDGVPAWAHGNAERRFGSSADPAMVNWYCDEMGKTSRRTMLALLEYVPTIDLTEVLPEIHAPTLVFAGTQAQMAPIDEARRCAELIPNARLVEIQDGPNQVHVTHAEQCTNAFRDFVRAL